jgi:hypothetical protein
VKHTLIVPVRKSKAGSLALQTGRLSSGERVGLAFTSEASLLLTLGPSQAWIRLGDQALKDMLAPLGVEHVRVDPQPIGQLAAGSSPQEPAPTAPARPSSAAKRLNVRRRPLSPHLATTQRPGVTSLGRPGVTSSDGRHGRNAPQDCAPRQVGLRNRYNAMPRL